MCEPLRELRTAGWVGVEPVSSCMLVFERQCCPFLRFNIRLEPGEGPIWLELSGPEGTKDFLNSFLTLP
jgi:hypothetical protein